MNGYMKTRPEILATNAEPARGSLNLYRLISPSGLAFISLLPLVLSLLIPRDLYELYAGESCLMCSSIWMPVFCLLCTAAFVFGANLPTKLRKTQIEKPTLATPTVKRAELKFVAIGLVIFALLNLLSFIILLSNTSGLIGLLLSGGGDVAKEAIDTEGSFSQIQPVLIYYNGYALARYISAKEYLTSSEQKVFSMLLMGAILLTVLIAVAKVARYEMIPVICSLLFVFAEHKARTQRITNLTLVTYCLVAFGIVAVVFSFFSLFRGFTELEDVIGTLVGYGPASYNHLVALLNGELRPAFAGTGSYAFPFIGHIPLFESMFHITETFGLPTAEETFLAEFVDTGLADLNRMYIWITMYGYVYTDLGFATFFFMFVYGYIARVSFTNYINGGAVGAFVYPLIFVAMVLTFSFNILLRPSTVAVLIIAFIISKIEQLVRQLALKNKAC